MTTRNWQQELIDAQTQGKDAVRELVTERHEFGMTCLHLMAEDGASANDIRAYVSNGADVDAKDEQNDTPLHWAADYGNVDAIKGLIASHANIDARNDRGDTALHSAADAATTRVLISEGADVDARNRRGVTPLHMAAGDPDRADVAKALLEGGASRDLVDRDGDTPFDYAKATDNTRVVDMMKGMEQDKTPVSQPTRTPSRSRNAEMEM